MRSKIAIRALLLALAVYWVVGLEYFPLNPWSPLNCRHEDIDINTGRIRHRRYLGGIRVSEHIVESPISRELHLTTTSPDWRRVNTFSPFVSHSPHYTFHAATNQVKELDVIWELGAFTPAAKQQVSRDVLRLWQTGQHDDAASEFISDLSALAMDRDTDAPITVAELPDHSATAEMAAVRDR